MTQPEASVSSVECALLVEDAVARCVTAVKNGQSAVDPSSRLGVLRLRSDVLPQLTSSDDLLVLAQATMPSYLRYGAHPYIVVVREQSRQAVVEHRFVGLFTVAAMNANVLEIPLISRRVNDALAMAHRDPSHPGQLLLGEPARLPRQPQPGTGRPSFRHPRSSALVATLIHRRLTGRPASAYLRFP